MEPGQQDTGLPEELDSVVKERRGLVASYRSRVEKAEAAIRRLSADGEIVGRVSLVEPVDSQRLPVDIPPEAWVKLAHTNPQMLGEGYYYIILDPKTLTLIVAVVAETVRLSPLSGLGAQPQLATVPLGAPHPLGVVGNVAPIRLVLRPLLAFHLGEDGVERLLGASGGAVPPELLAGLEPMPPTVPPDPDSPVAVPDPHVLGSLLAPSAEGVTVGGLAVMDSLYLAGGEAVPVRLPWSAMVKHVLVTGTTGSGKTSLVKNMMLSAARSSDVQIVVLDAGSDYAAGLLPGHIPPDKVTREAAAVLRLYGIEAAPGKPVTHPGIPGIAVVPCYQCRPGMGRRDYHQAAEDYRRYLERSLARSYHRLGCSLSLGEVEETEPYLYRLRARLDCRDSASAEQILYIAPRKILVGSASELARLDPYLTPRAREALHLLATRCHIHTIEDLLAVLSQRQRSDCSHILRTIHQETLRNLEQRLQAMQSLAVTGHRESEPEDTDLDYARLAALMARHGLQTLVLDLGYAAHRAPREAEPEKAKVLLGYRLLETLAAHMETAEEPRYAMLVIDEAHLFFPPDSRSHSQTLRSAIERLARLGRSRGISIVFSTHRETDVSRIIATLANTKIYLRTDRATAEELPLPPEYRRRLPYYRDHAAIAASYALRGGYLPVKNAPPPIGHRTA